MTRQTTVGEVVGDGRPPIQVLLSDEEQARRIRKIFSILVRRRTFIALMTVILFVAASTVIALIPREYTAEASVEVDPRKTDVVNIEAVISNLPTDLEGIATEVQV